MAKEWLRIKRIGKAILLEASKRLDGSRDEQIPFEMVRRPGDPPTIIVADTKRRAPSMSEPKTDEQIAKETECFGYLWNPSDATCMTSCTVEGRCASRLVNFNLPKTKLMIGEDNDAAAFMEIGVEPPVVPLVVKRAGEHLAEIAKAETEEDPYAEPPEEEAPEEVKSEVEKYLEKNEESTRKKHALAPPAKKKRGRPKKVKPGPAKKEPEPTQKNVTTKDPILAVADQIVDLCQDHGVLPDLKDGASAEDIIAQTPGIISKLLTYAGGVEGVAGETGRLEQENAMLKRMLKSALKGEEEVSVPFSVMMDLIK